MPIYLYECQKCGHRFEVMHGANEAPRKRCPECRGKVNKVFTTVGVVFKGGGFYCTDSRKSGKTEKTAAACDAKSCESAAACSDKAKVACEASGSCAEKAKTEKD